MWSMAQKYKPKKLRLAQRNRRKAKRVIQPAPPASLPPSPEPVAKPNEIAAWVNRVKGEIGRDRTIMQMQYESDPTLLGQLAKEHYLYVTRPSLWSRIWRRLGQIFKRRA